MALSAIKDYKKCFRLLAMPEKFVPSKTCLSPNSRIFKEQTTLVLFLYRMSYEALLSGFSFSKIFSVSLNTTVCLFEYDCLSLWIWLPQQILLKWCFKGVLYHAKWYYKRVFREWSVMLSNRQSSIRHENVLN